MPTETPERAGDEGLPAQLDAEERAQRPATVDVAVVRAQLDAADEMVRRLCLPRSHVDTREWIMSIPARPDHDPDLVIGQALHAARALLAERELWRTTADAHATVLEDVAALLDSGTDVASAVAALRAERDGPTGQWWRPVLDALKAEQEQHRAECGLLAAAGSGMHHDERLMTEGVILGIEYAVAALAGGADGR